MKPFTAISITMFLALVGMCFVETKWVAIRLDLQNSSDEDYDNTYRPLNQDHVRIIDEQGNELPHNGVKPSNTNQVTGGKPTGAAVTGEKPVGGAVTGGKPAGGTVTGGKPAGGAVTGGKPAGGAVTGGQPAGGAVTGGKPAGGAITGGKPASGPTSSGKPASGPISGGKPAAGHTTSGKPAFGTPSSGGTRPSAQISGAKPPSGTTTGGKPASGTTSVGKPAPGTISGGKPPAEEITSGSTSGDEKVGRKRVTPSKSIVIGRENGRNSGEIRTCVDGATPYSDPKDPSYYFVCSKLINSYYEIKMKCPTGTFDETEQACIYRRPVPKDTFSERRSHIERNPENVFYHGQQTPSGTYIRGSNNVLGGRTDMPNWSSKLNSNAENELDDMRREVTIDLPTYLYNKRSLNVENKVKK